MLDTETIDILIQTEKQTFFLFAQLFLENYLSNKNGC